MLDTFENQTNIASLHDKYIDSCVKKDKIARIQIQWRHTLKHEHGYQFKVKRVSKMKEDSELE